MHGLDQGGVLDVMGGEVGEDAGLDIPLVVDVQEAPAARDAAVNRRGICPEVHDIHGLFFTIALDEFAETHPLLRGGDEAQVGLGAYRHEQEVPSEDRSVLLYFSAFLGLILLRFFSKAFVLC